MTVNETENVVFLNKFSGKQGERPRSFVFNVLSCSFFMFLAFSSPFLMYRLTKHVLKTSLFQMAPRHLTAITLTFNKTYDQKMIAHNCAAISRTRHRYVIYTDDLSQPYCDACMCIPFAPINCKCPDTSKPGCTLCEKLHFVKDRVEELKEFVFLDSDLIILKDHFMDRLFARSRDFDFLASYGFGDPCQRTYQSPFNSGLFFIRGLPGINYGDLIDMSWKMKSNNDQNTISKFVVANYEDWDTLSLKWHCRFLNRRKFGIRPEECYTLHGRGNTIWETLQDVNKTLLQI